MQAEYLLSAAASADSSQLALYSVQPSPVCGNGVCEIGERPGGNSTSSLSQGCPQDCPVPMVPCPIPTGSLSMCGGPPRGVCATGSGACICSQGYAGSDCGSCLPGYYRQGARCLAAQTGGQATALAAWWAKNGTTIILAVAIGVAGAVSLAVLLYMVLRHQRMMVRTPTKPSNQKSLPVIA